MDAIPELQTTMTKRLLELFPNCSNNAKEKILNDVKVLLSSEGKEKPLISFLEFVAIVTPKFIWYKHCEILSDCLERVERGEIKRLMVFMPPRHGKSETVSRLFSSYFLYRNPDKWVGLASYSADLAFTLSRASRENYLQAGGTLSLSAKSVGHWETGKRGGLWSAGVGGSMTGKGFHLGIIDDPIKGAKDTESDKIRESQKEWYRSTFYTRAEPNASIIIVQTRWHEDDLSGYLLSQEGLEEDNEELSENWHILNLPAIAENGFDFPTNCTIEPDFRQENEALCPDRYSFQKLERIRNTIGGYSFDALYQQRPSAKEGNFFLVSNIEIVDTLPIIGKSCRAWDLASTVNGGDYTCGVKMLNANGIFYISDCVFGQWDSETVRKMILQTAQLDSRTVQIHLPQDAGQAGKDQAQQLVKMLAGYPVRSEPVTGAKTVRASGLASQMNAGNVKMLKASWNHFLLEQLRQFPNGKHDDGVDASADTFNEIVLPPKEGRIA